MSNKSKYNKINPFGDDAIMANNFYWVWDALNDNMDKKYRYINCRGGSSSSKTYSNLQCLLLYAAINPNKDITIIQNSIPNLKRGSFKDSKSILNTSSFIKNKVQKINSTDRYILFENGSMVNFVAYAGADEARGNRTDFAYFIEINNISEGIFRQVSMRTREKVLSCYNPSHPFFYSEQYLQMEDSISFISNYKDNPHCSPEIIKTLESYKETDKSYYAVYTLGIEGRIEGLIYNFEQDVFPSDFTWEAIGLDFGFSTDPAACVHVRLYNKKLYVRQLVYDIQLTNKELANLIYEKFNSLGIPQNIEIFCDSAEPKSIKELSDLGLNVIGVKKGNDSVRFGINLIKTYSPLCVDFTSSDVINELREYRFNDKGKIKGADHALDSLRYVALSKFDAGKKRNRMRWVNPNQVNKQKLNDISNFKYRG